MTRQRGFSLPELLVGLALGSLAVAGTLSAFALGRGSLQHAQAGNRLHERALYLLSVLEPELQLAGGYGLAGSQPPAPDSTSHAASQCGAGLAQRLEQPVEAHRGRWPLVCAAAGGGWQPGTDVLVVRRGSVAAARPDPGRLQLLTFAGLPGARLLADGRVPAQVTLADGHTELHDLLVRCYYVARRADGEGGGPALRVKSLTRIDGTAAFLDTEVLPGVADLQVRLGYRNAGQSGLRFIDPAALPDGALPVAVQLRLTLVGISGEVGARAAGRSLQLTRTIALRQTAGL